MEGDQQQTLVTLFLEIASGASPQTARRFLEATSWNLEEAIELFYTAGPTRYSAPMLNNNHASVWEPAPEEIGSDDDDETGNTLASLYQPPTGLIFHGSFQKAKESAMKENKWLVVNIQADTEFASHMLNRDTWKDEGVSQIIKTNFLFWQVHDHTEEGKKVCTYYRLDSLPAILVIDPITGQNMRSWHGMVEPITLVEDLSRFMDGTPSDHHASLCHKRRPKESHSIVPQIQDVSVHENNGMEIDESNVEQKVKRLDYLPLPEEPKGDRSMLCRVGVRLPDGRRIQRNFLRSDPVQLLWSFCFSELKEEGEKLFHLAHAIPGATKDLDYDHQSTFEESGLANTMISMTWV